MKIDFNSIVSMHYCLALEDGHVVDCSFDEEPLTFAMGSGAVIPGLEKALYQRKSGESFHVAIPAQESYGIYDENLKQTVSKKFFAGVDELHPGMQFQREEDGGLRIYTVTHVMDDMVTVDGNHPLAGRKLFFDVEILSVQEKEADDLEFAAA